MIASWLVDRELSCRSEELKVTTDRSEAEPSFDTSLANTRTELTLLSNQKSMVSS